MLALVLTNGLLAGAEIAILAQRQMPLDERARPLSRRARALVLVHRHSERFLATLQIGATVAATTLTALATYNLHSALSQYIAMVSPLAPAAEALALAVIVAALSFLLVVFGELVPKELALHSTAAYAAMVARPLYLATRLLAPMVWVASQCSRLLSRLILGDARRADTRLSPDELAHLVDQATRSGSVHPKAGEIAVRALDFGEVVVSEIMVPRTRIVAIPANATADELRRVLLEEAHAYFPAYNGTLDDIVGVVSTNDILALAWEKELIVLQDLLRPPLFVPENVRAVDVLRELQRDRTQFAIVIDEHGGTAGIVTLKDLLEELVGELFEQGENPPEHIRSQRDGSFVVPGNMAVRDANRQLPFALPEGEDFATVGGLATMLAGRIPISGDRFATIDGIPLEIVDASPRRVRWVRVGPAPIRPPSF